MVSSSAALYRSRKTLRRLDHTGEPGPISVQILGSEPAAMAEAARRNVDQGAQIIDINMGCPAKKVCKVAAGSALLRDPRRVAAILETVVASVEVPVTLKMRTGWDPTKRNGVSIARIAESAGIQALAVHGRTQACGYDGSAEYATIRAIKHAVNIPVIANGDIDTPEKARAVLTYTGADGVMIGRGAQGRPWLFGEAAHFLATGSRLPPPPARRIRDLLLEHLDALYEFYGEEQGVRIARKHIGWYCRRWPGSAPFRAGVNQATSAREQQRRIVVFFEDLSPQERVAA
jgi:tRNA-dihydrouridine synthase B